MTHKKVRQSTRAPVTTFKGYKNLPKSHAASYFFIFFSLTQKGNERKIIMS